MEGRRIMVAAVNDLRRDTAYIQSRSEFESPVLTPTTANELCDAIRAHSRVLAIGARTKPRLSAVSPAQGDVALISTLGLSGIIAYDPGEFTFTALAGTPLCEIRAALAERGIAILITDHSVIETLRITDRAYIIAKGKVFAEGEPHTIVADEQVRRIYLGSNFGEGISEEEERGLDLDEDGAGA
jgi:hypothetical protein